MRKSTRLRVKTTVGVSKTRALHKDRGEKLKPKDK